jgi:hypothetical protein
MIGPPLYPTSVETGRYRVIEADGDDISEVEMSIS